MNLLPLITFLHIISAIGLFVTWGLEYKQVSETKQLLTTNAVEAPLIELKNYRKQSMLAMLITLGTGIWLMTAFWGHASWMMVAMASLLLMIIISIIFSRKATSLKTDKFTGLSYLVYSVKLRIAIGMGIVALMVFKTSELSASLEIVFIFLIIGTLWILPLFKKNKI
jgi:hypothetical protein